MGLHTEYRPTTFNEIIGNTSIVKSIKEICQREKKKIPHTWLFTGPSGCGKSTIARIIGNQLSSDIQEINISDNSGIDVARKLLKTINLKALGGKAKVYLLEEVHRATKDFQNAMLRALEDTPEHVYFLLCTTEPEKLLPTIKNRCMKYEVSSLTRKNMKILLNNVLKKEKKELPNKIIKEIILFSEGCPRQALVTLDQIIDLDEDDMFEMIKETSTKEKAIIDLCKALFDSNNSWKNIATIIKSIDADPEKIRMAVLNYHTSVLLNSKKVHERSFTIIDCFLKPFSYTGRAALTHACAQLY